MTLADGVNVSVVAIILTDTMLGQVPFLSVPLPISSFFLKFQSQDSSLANLSHN